jgi:hypothetical protein
MMNKKQLNEDQFQDAVRDLKIGDQTREIAHGVLVEGKNQAEFVLKYGLSRGAISQAVGRVWDSHETKNLPEGYERVSAVLPKYRAYLVKKWNDEARNEAKQRVNKQ